MEKLVSVVIPTYKRPDTLGRAINSVLAQTYGNIEVIVVDDNGNETQGRQLTEQFMQHYATNSKVKYIKHEINKNGSAARNSGIRASKGDYIMFLDDDDEFFSDKVKAQVGCLESRDSSWGACYTKNVRCKNGKIIKRSANELEGDLLVEALGRNLFLSAGSNLMVRREIVEKIGGFDETFPRNQDLEFLVKILMISKLAFVNVTGLMVHEHPCEARKMTFDKLTELYLSRFYNVIDTLDEKSKKRIMKLINLQLFRMKIMSKKDMGKGFNMILKGEVNIFALIHYLFHLCYRKISKKSMGF